MEAKNNQKKQEKSNEREKDVEYLDDFYHYNPFGRGGGGAPLRDQHGKVIAERNPHLKKKAFVRQHEKRPKEFSVATRLKKHGVGQQAWGGGGEMRYDYHVDEEEPQAPKDFHADYVVEEKQPQAQAEWQPCKLYLPFRERHNSVRTPETSHLRLLSLAH